MCRGRSAGASTDIPPEGVRVEEVGVVSGVEGADEVGMCEVIQVIVMIGRRDAFSSSSQKAVAGESS